MLIIIGKIETSDGKPEAYRLMDTETRVVKDISAERIKNAVKADVKIKGFVKVDVEDPLKGGVKGAVRKEKNSTWKYSKVALLNGSGELVKEEQSKLLTVYGWHGFAEVKKYHLLNYKGEEIILNVQEFKDKVAAGLVNGATINSRTGKVIVARDLDVEIIS